MKTIKKYGKPPCLFKADIAPEDFWRLAYSFREQGEWRQMSYLYFDTGETKEAAELYNHDLRLRVRVKEGRNSLEIKDYSDPTHWDVGQKISDEDLRELMQGRLPDGEARHICSVLGISGRLRCIKVAHTLRMKIWIDDGILVLDMTTWPQARYEVEYRSEQKKMPPAVYNIKASFCANPRAHDKMEELWS